MFIEKLENTLNDEFNYSETENGALSYRTTGKELLDLNFAVTSLRSATETEIINSFLKAFYEDKELAFKWLFFSRDVRGGLGEKRLFRVVLRRLATEYPEIVKPLVQYIAFYGRFDDLFVLLDTPCAELVYDMISEQLNADFMGVDLDQPISLLAKWMPSINASSKRTKSLARNFIRHYNMSPATYRKTLSKLRKHLDIVERKMSSGEWDKISYESVPSRANLIYKNAFLLHDTNRREDYLGKVASGEATINAGVLYPHEIVNKYLPTVRYRQQLSDTVDVTLEELWKALPNLVNGDNTTLVVADGSGSMQSNVDDKGTVRMLDVANALAIYFAERASGEFKDKYITFSERPQLVDFSKCTNLREKIKVALLHDEVANTNIEAVFDLILTTAVKFNMKQEDIPKNILIISDMEFDSAQGYRHSMDERLFKTIANKYEANGYKLPRLCFWNLCSRTKTIPVIENDLGVALVSGFSVNVLKMVMSNKLDPFEVLVEQLMSERYAPVTTKVE